MNLWSFWSQLLSCYALYIVPKCNFNYHTEFETNGIILTYLKLKNQKAKKSYAKGIIVCFLQFGFSLKNLILTTYV